MIKDLIISTKNRCQLIDITPDVKKIVEKSNIENGIVLIFSNHTTASVILTEKEDGLLSDWENFFQKLVPREIKFEHNKIDNNGDSHILAGILGPGKIIPIEKSKLKLGKWQQIFFADFDGPRERRVSIKIING